MVFKNLLSPLPLLIVLLSLLSAGCGFEMLEPGIDGEYLIGSELDSISSISQNSEAKDEVVSLFDPTTRKIHKFDLESMAHLQTLNVKNPEEKHYLLYSRQGNFIVDLTKKHLSVFNQKGEALHNPLNFQGTPRSAAFNETLGLLVVYDNLGSVGMLKLNSQGNVENAWVGGPILQDDVSILCGDINDKGSLVLALSDGTIAIADLQASMQQKQWIFTTLTTPYDEIVWLAPLQENSRQILLKSENKVALFDLDTNSTLSEYEIEEEDAQVMKYSKNKDPHLLIKPNMYARETRLLYISDGEIKTRSLYLSDTQYLISSLDLATDSWMIIQSNEPQSIFSYGTQAHYVHNNPNSLTRQRSLTHYKFGSMLTLGSTDLPDGTQLKLARDFVFALFPSELGYAQRIELATGNKKELKLFNLNSIASQK